MASSPLARQGRLRRGNPQQYMRARRKPVILEAMAFLPPAPPVLCLILARPVLAVVPPVMAISTAVRKLRFARQAMLALPVPSRPHRDVLTVTTARQVAGAQGRARARQDLIARQAALAAPYAPQAITVRRGSLRALSTFAHKVTSAQRDRARRPITPARQATTARPAAKARP